MRKNNSKGKKGRLVKCPRARCKNAFRTRQTGEMICCSKCKRWFYPKRK